MHLVKFPNQYINNDCHILLLYPGAPIRAVHLKAMKYPGIVTHSIKLQIKFRNKHATLE